MLAPLRHCPQLPANFLSLGLLAVRAESRYLDLQRSRAESRVLKDIVHQHIGRQAVLQVRNLMTSQAHYIDVR
jgi:hypothetical protein